MRKKIAFALAMVVAVLSCAGYSKATVLGTIEYNRAGRGMSGASDMSLSISYPLPGDCESISLSWDVTSDDVGKTFFASAGSHENFDVFTYLLTNGTNNGLFLSDNHGMFIANVATGLPEPIEYESTLITGVQDGVDFEGYTIDSIALTVNELSIVYDVDIVGRGALIPVTNSNYSYNITYAINGNPIPEPATLLLFGLGSLALLKKRKA